MPISAESRLRAGITTHSAEETQALAAEFASELPVDAVLALHGDLGAGKTTFVQGLACGLGVTEPVTSPTFSIYNLHRGRRLLVHLDAYRLNSGVELEALMIDDFLVSPYCLAIEWPEKVQDWVPAAALHLDLALTPAGHRIQLRSSRV
jgi:tRNA threonylcarbamoyladenosine biosynthesis protein TsaE